MLTPDKTQEKIIELCKQSGITCHTDYSLKKLTTFKVGGNASLYVKAENTDQSSIIQKAVYELKIPLFILGGGSNLLISDEGFKGVVLQLAYPAEIQIISKSDTGVIARIPANMKSAPAAKKISNLGYTGMEFLTTIPGYIGGAIVQNAGCYGSEIRDILTCVEVSKCGELEILKNTDLRFAYRTSIFKEDHDLLIHYAEFSVNAGDNSLIQERILDFQQRRMASQPSNRKSAGSVFKNPASQKAWYYIQESGLPGLSIGDALVSPEHANFIVNRGNATAKDIAKLIQVIQQKVYEKFEVRLEPEIIFVGKF